MVVYGWMLCVCVGGGGEGYGVGLFGGALSEFGWLHLDFVEEGEKWGQGAGGYMKLMLDDTYTWNLYQILLWYIRVYLCTHVYHFLLVYMEYEA